MNLIGGKRSVKTPEGETVKFHVRKVIPWAEAEGGILRWMNLPAQISGENTKVGKANSKEVKIGDRILVIDIGGKISSMTAVMVSDGEQFEVIYDPTEQPFSLGIQDVLDTLSQELKGLYPDMFQGLGTIPLNMLEQAVRTGEVTLSGCPKPVIDAVRNSIFSLIDKFEQRYKTKHGGGKNFHHIVVTGGGGGLLYKHLIDKKEGILNHPNVYLADREESIHFANLRGGAVAFGAWLSENIGKGVK